MDLNAQVTDELVLSFYVPSEATMPDRLEAAYHVGEDTLEHVVEELGGIAHFHVHESLLTRSVPLTCDGDWVGTLALHVFLSGAPAQPKFPAIERLREKAAERA